MIPLSASLEFAALDFIGLGGYFGYARRTYEYEHTYTTGTWFQGFQTHTEDREDRYTYTSFGAKASFHIIPFLDQTFNFDHNLDGSKYDLYIAHFIGARVETWRTVDEDGSTVGSSSRDTDPIIMNPAIGARYMFSNFFGAYAEVGYGHFGGSELSLGLSLRI